MYASTESFFGCLIHGAEVSFVLASLSISSNSHSIAFPLSLSTYKFVFNYDFVERRIAADIIVNNKTSISHKKKKDKKKKKHNKKNRFCLSFNLCLLNISLCAQEPQVNIRYFSDIDSVCVSFVSRKRKLCVCSSNSFDS